METLPVSSTPVRQAYQMRFFPGAWDTPGCAVMAEQKLSKAGVYGRIENRKIVPQEGIPFRIGLRGVRKIGE